MESIPAARADVRPASELRPVSFLLCDMVDSTRLVNNLDAEDQVALFSTFQDMVSEVSARHSGQALEFAGDAGRVVFGFPQSDEDAPIDAVRCALALCEAARTYRSATGMQLQLRAGVAYGNAVVSFGNAPGTTRISGVVGPVCHLAARLAAVAPVGGVVVDQATRRLIGSYFDCRDLGVLDLKGFAEGARGWSVERETDVASRHEARVGGVQESRIIGRDAQLAALLDAWDKAALGAGGAILISGDAGIGKSSLSRALALRAGMQTSFALTLDCTPRTRNVPHYPIRMLGRRLAGIQGDTTEATATERVRAMLSTYVPAEELEVAVQYLGPLFCGNGVPIGTGESAERIRSRTNEQVLSLLHRLAERAPLLIRVEDMHWADPTTADLIRGLVGQCSTRRILVVVTTRPETGESRQPSFEGYRLNLEPLGNEEARAVALAAAGEHAIPEATLDLIVARGDGIPLYLEELARAAVEAGAGNISDMPATQGGHELPATLLNLTQARFGRLPELRPLVQAAAVLGREFPLDLLVDLLVGNAQQVQEDAVTLLDDGLLVTHGTDATRLRFRHALIQEAVYQTLLRGERQRLHSRVADLLGTWPAGSPEAAPDVVAFHLGAAGRVVEAVRHLIAASADNLARAAYREAEGLCRNGVALLEGVADEAERRELRLQLLVSLSVALCGSEAYGSPAVEAANREARVLCEEAPMGPMRYPVLRILATYHLVRGNLADAYAMSQDVAACADMFNVPAQRIDALCLRGYTSIYSGRLAEGRAFLEACIRLHREHDGARFVYPVPQDAATAAYGLLPTAAWLMGDVEAAESAISDGAAHVARLERTYDSAFFYSWVAGLRYVQRRNVEAIENAHHAYALAEKAGISEWAGVSGLVLAFGQSAMAPAPGLIEAIQAGLQAFQGMGVRLNAPYYLWGLARCLQQAGLAEMALGTIGMGLACAAETGETRNNAELMMLGAELAVDETAKVAGLTAAADFAEAEGAIATALRARLRLVVLKQAAQADVAWAEETLRLTESTSACPREQGWMAAQLARALAALALSAN